MSELVDRPLSGDVESEFFMIENTLIIGLGMIGGSLAKAIKENGFSKKVYALDNDPQAIEIGVSLGIIDANTATSEKIIASADLIVLAVPVKASATIFKMISPYLKTTVVISDVGSTKGSVIKAAKEAFGSVPANFIPAHPIAGSEKSGVAASNSALFNKHKVIITPHENSSPEATLTIARMWQSTGAEVLQMDVDQHDEVLAATSHLPHLLAFSLVDSLAKESQSLDIFRYAAGGFRDFTRIAASDPTMWSDVCNANQQAILKQIDIFTEGLSQLRQAVVSKDEQTIKGIFVRARVARERFGKMLQGTAYAADSESKNIRFIVQPGAELAAQITIPGDKSISHRAVIIAAISDGISLISGFLQSEDSMATVQALRDMGVVIEGPHKGNVKVYGVGMQGLCPPSGVLYMGNSGTSMRLLTGLLAAQSFDSVLVGDASLSSRPMDRVAQPLREMGAKIETTKGGSPIYITGGQPLKGITYEMPMASAQVKSALLLAGLYARGDSTIFQPEKTRDHSELLLENSGAIVVCDGRRVNIQQTTTLAARDFAIPGDFSSAAFFIVAALISPKAKLLLKNVGVNPTRIGLLHILKLMGAEIELLNQRNVCGEAVADILVRSSELLGICIPQEYVASAIDEFPVIFVAACFAKGKTIIEGIQELRHKESDRIDVMVAGLRELGIDIEENDQGVVIHHGVLQGGTVDSQGDHRTAMAFAIAGVRAQAQVIIENCSPVATSFPEFVEFSAVAGLRIRKEETNVSE